MVNDLTLTIGVLFSKDKLVGSNPNTQTTTGANSLTSFTIFHIVTSPLFNLIPIRSY
jgi:hypothetical protein